MLVGFVGWRGMVGSVLLIECLQKKILIFLTLDFFLLRMLEGNT